MNISNTKNFVTLCVKYLMVGAILAITLSTTISCSHKPKERKTAEQLYTEAMDYLKKGVYDIAGTEFEKIEDEYPFSKEATNGLIMASYSYYKAGQYMDSLRIIDYFIQSNPIHSDLDYMYYLRALNYYDRISSTKKARDLTEDADKSLAELIYKFPKTKYAEDAIDRKVMTETYLSGNEMEIGMFYLKNKNTIGATNHFSYVIENYPRSKFTPEAYYRLIEVYLMLGAKKEAKSTFKILKNDYNDTKWFTYGERLIKKCCKNEI